MKEGDKLCIRGLIVRGIVEGDQVDHTVLGTVGPCILKVLLLALTILHCNIQKQKGIDSYMSYGTCCICTGVSYVRTC